MVKRKQNMDNSPESDSNSANNKRTKGNDNISEANTSCNIETIQNKETVDITTRGALATNQSDRNEITMDSTEAAAITQDNNKENGKTDDEDGDGERDDNTDGEHEESDVAFTWEGEVSVSVKKLFA
jgi:hypothetical protein